MSTQCTIRFDNNPHGVYYSGQLVSGTVELVTTKQKTIRAIYITINGYAQVRWTESRSRKKADGKSENYIETFRGDEQYLSSRTAVLGHDTGNFFELQAGKYVYPFQIKLPPTVPTSYTGVYGQIRYEVILSIDRPWKYDNNFRLPFTVISPFDLNTDSSYRLPIDKKEEKQFCCGTCFYFKNDPIVLKLDTPFSGYAPGQNIEFTMSVDNQSNIDCREVKIKLVQTVQFSTRTPETRERVETTKVVEKRLGPVSKLSQKEYKDFLKIPAVAPSSLETCSIIKVKYSLDLTVKIGGIHRSVSVSVPVTIGTVPLIGTITAPEGVITTQPRIPVVNGQGGEHPPPYTSIAPPVYEEAVNNGKLFIDKDEAEKYGKAVPFVPKYPVYHSPNAPTPAPSPPTIGLTIPDKFPPTSPAQDDYSHLGIIPNPQSMYPTLPASNQPVAVPPQPDTQGKPIGWNP